MTTLIKSVNCKNCNGDLWDVLNITAYCVNCGKTRPCFRRSSNSGEMTKSQLQKIEEVQEWFKQYFRKENLTKFEIIYQDETGFVYLSVETTDHPLTQDGAYLVIGRRGGIKILSTYGLSKVHDKKFYAKFLSGKVGW